MLRLPALVLLTLAIAFGGGTWSAARMLKATSGFGSIDLGAWSAYPNLQTSAADPFARAHRAGDGRILLGRAEGLVFTARTDEDGFLLSGRCAYEISGATPPARFWTLRIADAGGAPVQSPPSYPDSLNSWTTLRRTDGTFSIRVNAAPEPGNWIRLDTSSAVTFVLTMVDTPTAASASMVDLDMPKISRIGCRDA
ncbi:DUF1214 domain-containing protein [Hoeflea olei]|uniref:DUF1214 domain-containing protein n=1 Tax=Hoeflea olei TaxID=1480615 RepID=A0A1C1YQR3_9HYPH|nr:DUF1214 domain-containing protein [Hoeflea olei]OCW55756.1 hypothetical protein AWJ14_14820 [Hoeflea olei]